MRGVSGSKQQPWTAGCFRMRALSGTPIRYGTARRFKNSLSNSDVSYQTGCFIASGTSVQEMSQDGSGPESNMCNSKRYVRDIESDVRSSVKNGGEPGLMRLGPGGPADSSPIEAAPVAGMVGRSIRRVCSGRKRCRTLSVPVPASFPTIMRKRSEILARPMFRSGKLPFVRGW